MKTLSLVPPHPDLLVQLHTRYQELMDQNRLLPDSTFDQFYNFWRAERRGVNLLGLDDGRSIQDSPIVQPQFINRPTKKLKGIIRTIVLLVDFSDQPASSNHTTTFYERMLFGQPGVFLTGSMREYYQKISNFDADTGQGIDIQGEVHGWFRMPQPLSFYANNSSGTADSYPRNAQGMAKDAVEAALKAGIDFSSYDSLGEGEITALFIIHAGTGAEITENQNDIWSHKWFIPDGIVVNDSPRIMASRYLTVPEDCNMGVCAHEWGHLAARWADYYDTGKVEKYVSQGLGMYCLMASGAWGKGGRRPTLPTGMLRMFHDWVPVEEVRSSVDGLELRPADEGGGVIIINNPDTMFDNQYVVVEYRCKKGWDEALPDEGIAVYLVDENIADVNIENQLAIELLQADGKRHLARIGSLGNYGDANDLYPSLNNRFIGKTTNPSLHLTNGQWTGIKIRILGQPGDDTMKINVTIEQAAV